MSAAAAAVSEGDMTGQRGPRLSRLRATKARASASG